MHTGPTGSRAWAWIRVLGGTGILAFLGWRFGTGAFIDGVRAMDLPAAVAACAIGFVVTVCCAWRWCVVAASLGVRLPLRRAIAAYYRSQLLNATLPGGVIGDVERAVRHGIDVGDVGLGVRAVVLERFAGQAVQVAVAAGVLFALPSPARYHTLIAVGAVMAAGVSLAIAGGALRGRPRWRQKRRGPYGDAADVRLGPFVRRTAVATVLASSVAMAGYLAMFVLAARTAGVTAPVLTVLHLTALALLAMVVPLNVAGWGPREGVAAWAFGTAGLTTAAGVSTAVTYGLLVLVAALPGIPALVIHWIAGRTRLDRVPEPKVA